MDYRLVLLVLFIVLVASVFYSQSCVYFRTGEFADVKDLMASGALREGMRNGPASLDWGSTLAPADFQPADARSGGPSGAMADRNNWNAATMAQADRAQHDAAQCGRTQDVLGRTQTFLDDNKCSRPDVFADDRVNINKNLDCRYRDDQKIEALISEETWCGPQAPATLDVAPAEQ